MYHDAADERLKLQIRGIQIVAVTLMMGLLSFGVVAFKLGQGKQPPATPIISYMAGGFGVMLFVMHVVVPTIATNQRLNGLEKHAGDLRLLLATTFQTKTILSFALLEGAAFQGLIAYIAEGHEIAIGVSIFMLFCMSIEFPGTNRVNNWIESNVETIRLKREQNN